MGLKCGVILSVDHPWHGRFWSRVAAHKLKRKSGLSLLGNEQLIFTARQTQDEELLS